MPIQRYLILEKSEWDKITGIVDLDEFNSIHLNTCNVCVDGCDKWITIRNGPIPIQSVLDTRILLLIQPIKPLVDKLDSLREALQNRFASMTLLPACPII